MNGHAGPFAAFGADADIAYARDDGMPFPGWAPPLLTDAQARAGYASGQRLAVIVGEPTDPLTGLVLDRGNARLSVRRADPPLQLVYAGTELTLSEARWRDAAGRLCWAHRVSPVQLRVARRPSGAAVWVEQFLAYAPGNPAEEGLGWPEFGRWDALAAHQVTPWVGEGSLELIDADGWLLDALESAGVPARWRELGRRYDAPRAFGLPPEMQATLAEPLGWLPAGRRWRKATEVAADEAANPGVVVVTDAMFAAGAGASGEIVTTVTSGEVQVALGLPEATVRSEVRGGTAPGSPSHPRPSTGAQVAVIAMLEAGGAAHGAVVRAVRDGRVPVAWRRVLG